MFSKTLKPLLLLFLALLTPTALCRSWKVGDTCPSTIKVTIPGHDYRQDEGKPAFKTMVDVHEALANCPNITSLDLRVTWLGCSEPPDRWSLPFSLSGGDSYPALKSLRLEGYDIWDRPCIKTREDLTSLELPGYERLANWLFSGGASIWWECRKLSAEQQQKRNLDLWLDAMDWTNIGALALFSDYRGNRDPEYSLLRTISPHMAALERLELQCVSLNTTTFFLESLQNNTLTHFTWGEHWHPEAISSLEAFHGLSIEHLDMHTVETTSSESPFLSVDQLHVLKRLPNLKHLALNIPRNGTWPMEMLSAVSEISSLRSAEFWLDIASACRKQKPDNGYYYSIIEDSGCTGVDQYRLPFVNETTALEVFKYLRTNKVGNNLTNLTLWAGDWSRPWDGPIYVPPWIEHRKTRVVCSASEVSGGEECIVREGAQYWEGKRWRQWDELQV